MIAQQQSNKPTTEELARIRELQLSAGLLVFETIYHVAVTVEEAKRLRWLQGHGGFREDVR